MSENPKKKRLGRNEVILRDHSYDGIQEFDQRLPNWWLMTLYGTIIFSVFYWFFFFHVDDGSYDERRLQERLDRIQAERMAALESFDDATLWDMSRNETIITRGRQNYQRLCQSCHLASLRGEDEPGGQGQNLVDGQWKYGGNPTDVMAVIRNGSPDRTAGMQAFESQLGTQGVAEVTAYIMSYHTPPQ